MHHTLASLQHPAASIWIRIRDRCQHYTDNVQHIAWPSTKSSATTRNL